MAGRGRCNIGPVAEAALGLVVAEGNFGTHSACFRDILEVDRPGRVDRSIDFGTIVADNSPAAFHPVGRHLLAPLVLNLAAFDEVVGLKEKKNFIVLVSLREKFAVYYLEQGRTVDDSLWAGPSMEVERAAAAVAELEVSKRCWVEVHQLMGGCLHY